MSERASTTTQPERTNLPSLYRLAVPLLLALVMAMSEAHADFNIRATTLNGTTYVRASDVAAYYGLALWSSERTAVLHGLGHKVVLTLEKREATIDGVVVHLGHAPTLQGGIPMVAERDFVLILDPVLREWGVAPHVIRRIAIDAGHGGKDEGARGAHYREKDLTLTIASRLRDILASQGYDAFLTRTDDTFIELADRPELARRKGADLFISIHFNSATAKSASGIETYVVTPVGTPSTPKTVSETRAEAGNKWDLLNHRLAFDIQRYLIQQTGAVDRGVKKQRFLVIRDAPCPSVLVELGFLSNAEEERRIGTPAYRERLCVGLANGIISLDQVLYRNRQRR